MRGCFTQQPRSAGRSVGCTAASLVCHDRGLGTVGAIIGETDGEKNNGKEFTRSRWRWAVVGG